MLPCPTDIFPHSPPDRLLFGPGPANIDPRVEQSMSTRMVGHLDPYYIQMMKKTQELLRWVWQTENDATFTISGTGTSAMEASIANIIEPGDSFVVATNGYFGTRLAEIGRRYGAVVHELPKTWGEVYTLEELDAAIQEFKPKVLGLVHAETSTGALQPMDGIGELCHKNDCLLLLDTVTSMGGVPVFIDKWGVDVAYSCSQKCLGSSPGASPITFSPRAVASVEARKTQPSTFYFDLKLLLNYWNNKAYHHTTATPVQYGLYTTLSLIAEEGLEERWARHERAGNALREGLEGLGMTLNIQNPEIRMPQLTTVQIPEGVDAGAVIGGLRDKYNIAIAGGLGELAGKIFRIGMMGYNATEENVAMLLDALKEVLETPNL